MFTPEREEFSFLPDEMIVNIVEYLDSFSLLAKSIPICKQFKRISQEKFLHLKISFWQPLNYEFIHQCASFRTLTSLDLKYSSIIVEDFSKLIQSGNLVELKHLSLPSGGDLVIEIGKVYNECLEQFKKGLEVEFCLPKLKVIHLENVCQLSLINPIEYCNKIKSLLQGNGIKDVIKSKKGEFFGKSKELQTILERSVLPAMFPELFKGMRILERTYLLFGPMKSGKGMILDALNDSIPCNVIEPFKVHFYDLETAIRISFNISKIFSKHILSFLEFREDPLKETTSSQRNRRAITEFLIQMASLNMKENQLSIFVCNNRPNSVELAIRRRLCPRIQIKLLTGDDLLMFVKYQLEKRWHNFTMNQIEEITKICEGYSPFEIEEMLKSIETIECLKRKIEKSPPINSKEIIKENSDFEQDFGNNY